MPWLGDIFLNTVYSEKPTGYTKSTDHPVEGGENIVDHIERQPRTLDITGIVTGPDAAMRLSKLRRYRETGKLVTYRYRNWVGNMLIERLETVHDSEVDKAFKFSITLKEVRVAKPSVIKALQLPQRVQVKSVTNKGRQQSLTKAEKAVLVDMGHKVG